MKRAAIFGYLLTCFLLVVFLPRDTRGIELPKQAIPVHQDNNVTIYPNPVKDFLSIQINPTWTQNADLQFEIRNILGNAMPVEVERVDQDVYRIDTANYPAGYYLLMIQCSSCKEKNNKSRNAFKFLKQ